MYMISQNTPSNVYFTLLFVLFFCLYVIYTYLCVVLYLQLVYLFIHKTKKSWVIKRKKVS
jgi:hypothetical protein